MSCLRSAVIVLAAAGVAASGCNNDELGGSTETMATSSSTTGDPSATAGSTAASETTTGTSGETTTTGETTTEGEDPDPLLTRVEKILAALDVAMYACPNRAWPNIEAKYRARQVLLGSVSENRAWIWNWQEGGGEPPVVTEGELDSLPPEWASNLESKLLGGALTLGIALDATQEVNETAAMEGIERWPEDWAIYLVLRQAFHVLGPQDGWVGDGERMQPYPEPWEPRYLRSQLLRALLAEVLEGGDDYGPAAHWWGRLQSNHAQAMTRSRQNDRFRGSAEFATRIQSALVELGCDASDDQLLDLVIAKLAGGIGIDLESFAAAREYPELGVLGGLLLRRDGVPDWEQEVRSGTPPVDYLMAEVSPTPQPDDPEVMAGAQEAVATRNAEAALEIEPMLAAMADPSVTRLAITLNWLQGTFGVGGFYFLDEEPGKPEVILQFSALLGVPNGPTIEVQELTSMVGVPTPCQIAGPGTVVLTVPTAALEVNGDLATTKTPELAFENLGVAAVDDANGLPWLCPLAGGGDRRVGDAREGARPADRRRDRRGPPPPRRGLSP